MHGTVGSAQFVLFSVTEMPITPDTSFSLDVKRQSSRSATIHDKSSTAGTPQALCMQAQPFATGLNSVYVGHHASSIMFIGFSEHRSDIQPATLIICERGNQSLHQQALRQIYLLHQLTLILIFASYVIFFVSTFALEWSDSHFTAFLYFSNNESPSPAPDPTPS